MSRTTRLKLRLNSKMEHGVGTDNPLTGLSFGAVYSPDEKDENSVFGKYTPFANLSTSIVTENTGHFEVGMEYYVDIVSASE